MENKSDDDKSWESCCFRLNQHCVVFIVQTIMGSALLVFSAYMLTTEKNCDRAAPYWGLIGTIAGFFFNKLSNGYSGVYDITRVQSDVGRQAVTLQSVHI
jgi:hypothetical protein